MDVATSMYDHSRSAQMQHMNHTSATSPYHHTPASGGGVSNAMSAVSDIHKRDKELIYGYVRYDRLTAQICMSCEMYHSRSTDLSENLSDRCQPRKLQIAKVTHDGYKAHVLALYSKTSCRIMIAGLFICTAVNERLLTELYSLT